MTKRFVFLSLLAVSAFGQSHSLVLCDQNATVHCVTLTVPASISSSYTFVLPAVDGTTGQFLKTNGSGLLSWANGGGSAAGSTGDVQFNTSGAFDADTGKLFWDKTNHRLGVGTASPSSQLTVSGTSTYNETFTGGSLFVNNSANSNNGMDIGFDVAIGAGFLQSGISGVGYKPTLINPNGGNVGIGTTTPSRLLHLYNTTGDSSVLFNTNLTGLGVSHGLYVGVSGGATKAFVWNYENAALGFATNNLERMTISAAGNVGIGTPSPTSPLTVAGIMESTSGGVKFPDGTTQTTAASAAPFVGASYYLNSNTSTISSGGGLTSIIYDSSAYDTASIYSGGNFTAPVTGYYHFTAQIGILGTLSNSTTQTFRLVVHNSALGGTLVAENRQWFPIFTTSGGTLPVQMQVATDVQLTAGDSLTVEANCPVGTCTVGGGSSGVPTRAWMFLIQDGSGGGGGGGGVTQITAGTNVTISPSGGTGNVTINATGGGSGLNQLTGDVTAGPGTGSQVATLATVNSGSGVCGDSTHVCQVTTNGKGLVTTQTPVGISGAGGAGPWSTSGTIVYYNGGNVGIGTAIPAQKLSVVGTIESTSGGFKFPDGTTQTTSAGGVSQIIAGTNVTISPSGGTGAVTINSSGGSGGVSQITAGTGISLSPSGGTGNVTVTSSPPNFSCSAHEWIDAFVSGGPACSRPGATDISGLATSATTDTTNAGNITSGTLSSSLLPGTIASNTTGNADTSTNSTYTSSFDHTPGQCSSGDVATGINSDGSANCVTHEQLLRVLLQEIKRDQGLRVMLVQLMREIAGQPLFVATDRSTAPAASGR